MPDEWFVRRGEIERGPLALSEVKRLVARGVIAATDLVKTSDQSVWREVGTIKGLLPSERSSVRVPPPPLSADPQIPPSGSPPKKSNAANNVQAGFADILSTAKQAKDLASTHARKTQITQMTLPKAYLALGKDVFERGNFQEQFSELFQQISSKNDELARVAATNSQRPQATDLKGKLQSGAANIVAQGQAAKLNMQRDSLLKQLGKQAFESHGTSAGPSELLTPITSANEEIARLDDQIGELSSGDKGPLWRRLPVAALFTVVCWPIGMLLVWLNPQLSRRSKAIWTGASVGAFALLFAIVPKQPHAENRASTNITSNENGGSKTSETSTTSKSSKPDAQTASPPVTSGDGRSDEQILNSAGSVHEASGSPPLIRLLPKPTSIVQASYTTPSLELTPNGEYLSDGSDVLHVPSGKWAIFRSKNHHSLSPFTKETACVLYNHAVKTNLQQLTLTALNGDPSKAKATLNLRELHFPAGGGGHYMTAHFSPSGKHIVIDVGQGTTRGYGIFTATPELREVATFDSPRDRNGTGNNMTTTAPPFISNEQLVVSFDEAICVYNLATATLTSSWSTKHPKLIGFTSKDGAFAAVTEQSGGDKHVVEIFGPEKTNRRTLFTLKEVETTTTVTPGSNTRSTIQKEVVPDRSVLTVRPEHDEIVLLSPKGLMEYLSLSDGTLKRSVQVPGIWKNGFYQAVTQDRGNAVLLSMDGLMHVWSFDEARTIALIGPTLKGVQLNLTVSNGASIIATVGEKKNINFWKVNEGVLGPAPAFVPQPDGSGKNRGPNYFTLTKIEESEGWSIPDRGFSQNAPAPPVKEDSYLALRNGMDMFQVADLLGGWAHKQRTESGRNGPTWWFRDTQVYVGAAKGSIVVLVYEHDTRMGRALLVKKLSRGL